MTKTELMTTEREIELIRLLPDKKALDELVLANTGLIHKVVHRFPIKNSNCSYDDLFQAGIEGLIHGIGKYDVTRGYRLSTYCYRWIQAYVSRYYQNQGKTIRIPVHMANVDMKTRKVSEQLTHELGRTPTDAEVADIYPEAEKLNGVTSTVSLNATISEDEELEALCGYDKTEEIDYQLQCELMLDKLKTEVSPRDFNIFVYRNGLLGKSEHTLGEIAEYHGITRARVHQVTNECFNLMKALV